ncbi:hypothetical protein [Actinokineospora inagensis]|uniref:hypothetical protein n=1 Tax=Actinokineospora inagensis TaxID=103730 RepID=UPI0004076257|nr:hypothetical protein [Actinokineospora inagensis]
MSTVPDLPLGNDDGDAVYLAETLRHERIDLLLDDSAGVELARSAVRQTVWLVIGTVLLFLFISMLSGVGGSSSRSSSSSGTPWLLIGVFVAVAVGFIRWIIFIGTTMRKEPVSEWATLLVGKAAAADSVYSHVAGRLRDRQLPIQNYVARRTAGAYNVTGNRLVLVDGIHYVYVSVFAYGTSLYLGWSMWRIRSGSDLYRDYRAQSSGDRLDQVGRLLNLDRLKAMREAVHSVCREALHTAVEDGRISEGYGFPNGMPHIEGLPYATAPRPQA